MYDRCAIDDVESREIDGIEPKLRAIGYELRPGKMRPSVWEFEAGESNNRHHHEEQEELYVVLSGSFEMEIEDDRLELEANEVVVVDPEAGRQLTAREDSRLLVVGAPNVKDDGVVHEG